MNKPLLLTLGACLLACAIPANSSAKGAGDADKAAKKEHRKALRAIFVKYDKNSNDVLDPDERAAIRADFATDTSLKVLDTNNDGKLDDTELDALKAPKKHKKNKHK